MLLRNQKQSKVKNLGCGLRPVALATGQKPCPKIYTLENLHKTEKTGRERTRKPKKKGEIPKKKEKKRQPVFAALLFEFWPTHLYYLNSVCVLQPWIVLLRFSLVFVGQISAQDSSAISLPL